MMNIRNLFSLFLWLFIFYATSAQNRRIYTTDQGLSSTLINQIIQDKNGFIWIATEYGLNKYDGYHFQSYTFQPKGQGTLGTNYIQTLFEDSEGHLLVGGINGLMEYEEDTDSFRKIPLIQEGTELPCHVMMVYSLHNGDIWITTAGHGLFQLSKDRSKALYLEQEMKRLNYSHFNRIFEDSRGRIWLSSEYNGMVMLSSDHKQFRKFSYAQMGSSAITGITEEWITGHILAGSRQHGVLWYDESTGTWKPMRYDHGGDLSVTTFMQTDSKILVGTDGQGVKSVNPQGLCLEDYEFLSDYPELSRAKIHTLLRDRNQNLWLGWFQKGVVCLPQQHKAFGYFGEKSRTNNPIGEGCVMSVYRDQANSLWIGTDSDGLFELTLEGERKNHYDLSTGNQKEASTVLCTFEDSDHHFWVGTFNNGLMQLDRKTGQVTRPLDINCQQVYAIVEDQHKNLYIGTGGAGFYIYNLSTHLLTHFESKKEKEVGTTTNVLPNDWINSLFVDSEGLLWIGHYTGITCFQPETRNFKPFKGTNTLISDKVGYAFNEDKAGNIWIGTAEGLYRFHKKNRQLDYYSTESGLQNNVICSVTPIGTEFVWISTYKGVAKFNPKTQKCIYYYSEDGLQGNEFTHGACFYDKRGILYLGGTNGVTYFEPNRVRPTLSHLEVLITDFRVSDHTPVMDKAVFKTDKFTLSHHDNTFRIDFSTLQYQNLGQTAYQYRMVELDKHWSTTQPGENHVLYNQLAPGSYTFQVRAVTHDLSSEIRTVHILITPPWYQSWWAILLQLLVLIALVLFIINYIRLRYRQKQERLERLHTEKFNEAKQQFFINISHEIRTPLTLIINPLEQLLQECKEESLRKQLRLMYKNSQRLLLLINQLMDMRKIEKGQMQLELKPTDLVGIIEDVMLCFEPTANQKNIHLVFEHKKEHLLASIDAQNFDKVLMNLFSNALKYTPNGGEIEIKLSVQDGAYEISVADTGIGIDPNRIEHIFERFYQINNEITKQYAGTGIGLHLSQQIVELHHGSLRAENRTDCRGSRFIIRIPYQLWGTQLQGEEMRSNTSLPSKAKKEVSEYLSTLSENESELSGNERKNHRTDIFLVEDEGDIREYYAKLLSPSYQVKCFDNGKKAYEELLARPPKLVISDVMMPEMDGFTLCEKIKQNVRINHIPVILLTAKSSIEDNTQGMRAGADAFFVKPVNIELIKSSIQNLLENRHLLQSKFSGAQEQDDKLQGIDVVSANQQLMNKIMKVINENISNSKLNVDMLSKEVGLSRVHLYRKVKELTDLSVHEFVISLRLKQAEKLLHEADLSIADVAYATGFASTSHLSVAFKKVYGCSPTNYKSRVKAEK